MISIDMPRKQHFKFIIYFKSLMKLQFALFSLRAKCANIPSHAFLGFVIIAWLPCLLKLFPWLIVISVGCHRHHIFKWDCSKYSTLYITMNEGLLPRKSRPTFCLVFHRKRFAKEDMNFEWTEKVVPKLYVLGKTYRYGGKTQYIHVTGFTLKHQVV